MLVESRCGESSADKIQHTIARPPLFAYLRECTLSSSLRFLLVSIQVLVDVAVSGHVSSIVPRYGVCLCDMISAVTKILSTK
jgi:hypothetical protein